MSACRLTPDAVDDIDAIWSFIAQDSPEAAYAVEREIAVACAWLAEGPLRGHLRRDLTKLPVRFWTLPRYANYVIVYRPESRPLEVIRILHGMRDIKHIMRGMRS